MNQLSTETLQSILDSLNDDVRLYHTPTEYVNVKSLVTELLELRKDRERLEWMINEKMTVLNARGKYWMFDTKNAWHSMDIFKTPREAIDAAMGGNNGK